MRPGGIAISFSTVIAVTVLPQPDSPTTPSVSPRVDGEVDAVDGVQPAVVGGEVGLQAVDLEQRMAQALVAARPPGAMQLGRPAPHHITLRGSSASRRPSPTKLIVSTVRKIASAREQRPVRRDVEVVLAVEEDAAPGRDVRREAEAEEGQRRLGDDRRGDVDGAGDDHRAQRIGQDVAHDLARHAGAERARRLDEFLLAQREELRAHQPRHRHPAEAADHDDDQDEDAAPRGRRPPSGVSRNR